MSGNTIARHINSDTIRATARHRARLNRRRAVLRFRAVWAARFSRMENVVIGLGAVCFLLGCAFTPALVAVLLGSL